MLLDHSWNILGRCEEMSPLVVGPWELDPCLVLFHIAALLINTTSGAELIDIWLVNY